jgi:hypothetical protein
MREVVIMKLGLCIAVPESISTAYSINTTHRSVHLYMNHPIVSKQQLGKRVTTAMNTYATIELL